MATAQNSIRKEPAAAAVALKFQLLDWRWPIRPKHIVRVYNEDNKKN
jgi:hypothetical protein